MKYLTKWCKLILWKNIFLIGCKNNLRSECICTFHPQNIDRVGGVSRCSDTTWVGHLQWRHNERECISNHRRLECLLNRLLRRRSKKSSKLRVSGLCWGNSPVTDELPTKRASNAENVSVWWRHHGTDNARLPDICAISSRYLRPLLLTWFNYNPSRDT